jgi:hypothetical protein
MDPKGKRQRTKGGSSSTSSGAGRTITEFYIACGQYVGKLAGYWAHRMGLGPNAVAKRIEDHFENREVVLLDLIDLRREANGELLMDDWLRLMKFALPYASFFVIWRED